jgi:hypothetical protein
MKKENSALSSLFSMEVVARRENAAAAGRDVRWAKEDLPAKNIRSKICFPICYVKLCNIFKISKWCRQRKEKNPKRMEKAESAAKE